MLLRYTLRPLNRRFAVGPRPQQTEQNSLRTGQRCACSAQSPEQEGAHKWASHVVSGADLMSNLFSFSNRIRSRGVRGPPRVPEGHKSTGNPEAGFIVSSCPRSAQAVRLQCMQGPEQRPARREQLLEGLDAPHHGLVVAARPPPRRWPNRGVRLGGNKLRFFIHGFGPAGNRRFWGSGRPRLPQKPFQRVGVGFAPHLLEWRLGPPGPPSPQTSAISGQPKNHVPKTQVYGVALRQGH